MAQRVKFVQLSEALKQLFKAQRRVRVLSDATVLHVSTNTGRFVGTAKIFTYNGTHGLDAVKLDRLLKLGNF